MKIPRLVIAGTGSGVGKTTLTLALIQAFQARGLKVACFKCGPDYLDPTYHSRVSGRTCHNLDGWMMGQEAVLSTFQKGSQDADIALIEGVMGLFDGLSPSADTGSTAEISKWLQAPVLLVVDAKGMARTFAPIVMGLTNFDPNVKIRGVIANFIGSLGHLSLLKTALASKALAPQVLGGLPKSVAQVFPERHLGLHCADEKSVPDQTLQYWGNLCETWLDLDGILQIAREAVDLPNPLASGSPSPDSCNSSRETLGDPPSHTRGIQSELTLIHSTSKPSKPVRIGVALDAAFHFYYENNFTLLRNLGAELIYFSPLKDTQLPEVDGLYIGGGYPELHAQTLSQNQSLLQSIRNFGEQNRPIYAECGGLMYLSREIKTLENITYPMVGLIPATVSMNSKLKALGYVEVATERETLLGPAGLRFRGHQFRYSELHLQSDGPIQLNYRVRKRRGNETFDEGYSRKQILASYVHAHWASNPAIAQGLIDSCRKAAHA